MSENDSVTIRPDACEVTRRVRAARIYIPSPLFTINGTLVHLGEALKEVQDNVVAALRKGELVMQLGGVPYVPHLNVLWDTISPHEVDYWLYMDEQWIYASDALYRFGGKSSGADKEIGWAAEFGLPILHSDEALRAFMDSWNAVKAV